MHRLFAALSLAPLLAAGVLGGAGAYERSLGDLREDVYTVEKSLGNMSVPVGPGLDARILDFTAPEFLSPIPPGSRGSACLAGCTYCRDGCFWHWRSNCYGDQCEPQFAQCMASCWRRSCEICGAYPGGLRAGGEVPADDTPTVSPGRGRPPLSKGK